MVIKKRKKYVDEMVIKWGKIKDIENKVKEIEKKLKK